MLENIKKILNDALTKGYNLGYKHAREQDLKAIRACEASMDPLVFDCLVKVLTDTRPITESIKSLSSPF